MENEVVKKRNKKKLIIGAKGIKGASVCIDWMEPLPVIGDFHETYIYLPSFTQEILERILNEKPTYFEDFRTELFQALKAGLTIYLITAPEIHSEKLPTLTNYKLLPFSLTRINKKVETFKGDQTGYYENVEYSDGFFEKNIGSDYLNSNMNSTNKVRFLWKLFPIIETLHSMLVSFSVRLTAETHDYSFNIERWKLLENYGGTILLVPPTTRINSLKGLENLIDDEPEDNVLEKPTWFSKVKLPQERVMVKNLKTLNSQRSLLEIEIHNTAEKIAELEKYKWILRLKDKALEKSVDLAFNFIGLPLTKGRLYQEDRWLEIDGCKIPIEIKGHEKSMRSKDIRQIIHRTDEAENKIGKTAGILIANPYCDEIPKKRKPSFDDTGDKIITKALAFDVALLDTRTIFKCIKTKLQGNEDVAEILKNKLTQLTGVIEIKFSKITPKN